MHMYIHEHKCTYVYMKEHKFNLTGILLCSGIEQCSSIKLGNTCMKSMHYVTLFPKNSYIPLYVRIYIF